MSLPKLSRWGFALFGVILVSAAILVASQLAPSVLLILASALVLMDLAKALLVGKLAQVGFSSVLPVVLAEGLSFLIAVALLPALATADQIEQLLLPVVYCMDFLACRAASCMVMAKYLWK